MKRVEPLQETIYLLAGGRVLRLVPASAANERNASGASWKRFVVILLSILMLGLGMPILAQANNPPTALPDVYSTPLDTPLVLTPDILANDSDPDGDLLSLVSFDQPVNGSLVEAASVLTYTPTTSFVGLDSFVYTITDGTSNSLGKVFIEVGSPDIDIFQIAYGDTVSDGVPGAGAGNIETAGAQDVYIFQGVAGQEVILDSLVGRAGQFWWLLTAPDGTVLFDSFNIDRRIMLLQTGTYTLTVRGSSASTTGVYSFRLLLVPPPQIFAISIGDTISDGVPAPGAGNLEVPGAVDIYTFDGIAGGGVIFDALVGNTGLARVILTAPDGTELFSGFYLDQQAAFSQSGTYTLRVEGLNITSTGIYSFQLLNVAPPQIFAISIGDTVSDGIPAPGAGNLEVPGAVDVYTFDAIAGQEVIFDWLSGSNVLIGWRLEAPDATVLFDGPLADQQIVLPQTGTYTLTVRGNNVDDTGAYSFQLLSVPSSTDQFVISIGDTVSDGVPAPGAGNLEVPGAVDIYTFDGVSGQSIIFDWLSGSNVQIGWRLEAPDNSVLFDTVLEDQQVALSQSGTHTLIVAGNNIDDTGTYAFVLLEVAGNSNPVANDDAAATDEDVPLNIDVLSNDTDTDGDTLVVDSVTQPANGAVTNNGADVTYTPNPDFNGTDSFDYTVTDGGGGVDTASITVTINPVNDSPTLNISSDPIEANEGETVTRSFTVADVDGDVVAVQAQPGALSDLGGGSFQWTYLPDDGPAALSVDVSINDGHGGAANATFDLTVLNVPPTAAFANTTGTITAPGTVTLMFSDQDDPSQSDTSAGFLYSYDCTSSGTFTLAQSTLPSFSCQYDTAGTYAARGRIEDKDGGFTDLLAEVVVEAASNTAPDALDDAATTDEDVLVTIHVLANDTDADGNTLVVDSVTQPANGTIVNNGAEITYTPFLDFNGMDSFDYTVIDGSGGSDTATVNITVNPVNDTPVIESPGDQSNIEGDLVSLSVLASDPDGDMLSFSASSLPNGLSIDSMTGVISGNVAVGSSISSPYSVLLTVTDPGGLSASAAISWIIDPLIASPLPVIIDIKPGVPPNCINNNGQGVIPVAILSSVTFDATQVDPASVQLQGLQVRAVGNPNNLQAYIEDANGDGLVDLVVQIDNGSGAFASGDTMATLTAYLFDGRAVSGSDTICVVP